MAALLASCAQDAAVDEPRMESAMNKIYATIDDSEYANSDDDTRVELNDKKQTVWTAGDKITVFYSEDVEVWQFDGNTGDRSGSFSYLGGYGYKNPNINYKNKYYALYLADLTIAYYNDGTPAFTTTVPSVQYYKNQSYGLNTNAMLGVSSDGKNYKFMNLLSYLRLSLTGDKVIKKIELTNNADSNSAICGTLYVNIDGSVFWRTDAGNHSNTITLDCGDGVQLSSTPTDFYFTLPAVELSNGISVMVTFTDGTVFPKSTSKSITLERNTIQPMKCFDTGGEVAWQTVSILHSGSKIYAPYFYGSSALTGYIYWGDDYMSDVNSVTSYTYEDGAASHAITVKAMGATAIEIDNCQGISEIDLTNF